MTLTPMSGAGRIKGDAIDANNAYVEIKDANASYTLTGQTLHKAWIEAVRNDHTECRFIIKFANGLKLDGVVTKE